MHNDPPRFLRSAASGNVRYTAYNDTSPADGVPDRPGGSGLRAKDEFDYDARGRVFRSRKFGVDPNYGTVLGSLKTDFWYATVPGTFIFFGGSEKPGPGGAGCGGRRRGRRRR